MKTLENVGSAKTDALAVKAISVGLKGVTVAMNLATSRRRELLRFEGWQNWIKGERAKSALA